MTKRNNNQKIGKSDTKNAGGCGDSRTVGGFVPHPSPTRKTIRRNMLERLVADERGDIHLNDEEYDFIIKTLCIRDDDESSCNISPILPEKTVPILPISPNSLTRGCPNSSIPQSSPPKIRFCPNSSWFSFRRL